MLTIGGGGATASPPTFKQMLLLAFKEKLAKIDKRLYVRDESRNHIKGEWHQVPLYIRIAKSDSKKSNYNQLSPDAQRWLEAKEAGQFDEHVCGVPWPWVPEYDIFDLETGREVARGWRTIAQLLIKKNIAPREKVRRVFGTSVGEYDYDKLNFDAKKRRQQKSP